MSLTGLFSKDGYTQLSGFYYDYHQSSADWHISIGTSFEGDIFYSFNDNQWYVDDGDSVTPWTDADGLCIEITGGTDVANQDFID